MPNPLEPSEPDGPGDIDKRVPPKIMRLTQHLHNLIYIRFFYEQIGQQPPEWIKGEMVRAQGALLEELDSEQSQGGAFHIGVTDETARQSGQGQPTELEGGTKKQGGFARRR